MESDVIAIRRNERHEIKTRMDQKKQVSIAYRYDEEGMSIRRKGFWVLPLARDLVHNFIPGLSHDSDGLIFQVLWLPVTWTSVILLRYI